jgi:hypothetical protein
MRRQDLPPVNRLKHGVERECTAILLRQKAQIARCFGEQDCGKTVTGTRRAMASGAAVYVNLLPHREVLRLC